MEKKFRKPTDILHYMHFHYLYGWKDKKNYYHLRPIDKELYQTMKLEEIVENRIGTSIEQAQYFKYYLNKMNIPNRMFCVVKENLCCFILYEEKGHVYHLEHLDRNRRGLFEYPSYKIAIEDILNKLKEENANVVEIPFLPEGMGYEELVNYIKSLEDAKKVLFLKM